MHPFLIPVSLSLFILLCTQKLLRLVMDILYFRSKQKIILFENGWFGWLVVFFFFFFFCGGGGIVFQSISDRLIMGGTRKREDI